MMQTTINDPNELTIDSILTGCFDFFFLFLTDKGITDPNEIIWSKSRHTFRKCTRECGGTESQTTNKHIL